MKRILPAIALFALAGCGGGGDNEITSLVLESLALRAGPSRSCEVFGRVLNTDAERTCDGCLSFVGFDPSDNIIAEALACMGQIPPSGHADFAATLRDSDGRLVPCSAFDRVRPSGFPQVCK